MKIVSLPDQAIEKLKGRAYEACNVLKVMSNPDRLLLLCMMMDVERSVGELESLTGIRQPTLSQQLGILRFEELVQTRRDGKNIYYMLASPMVAELMHTLYQTFCLTSAERNK
jgi:DNA-binding transcriptional ArsR family regulator